MTNIARTDDGRFSLDVENAGRAVEVRAVGARVPKPGLRVWLTPQEARDMAVALVFYADEIDERVAEHDPN